MGVPTLRTARLEAPMGGVNTVDGASSMPPSDCVWAYNIIPTDLGLSSRPGYAEHVTGLTGGSVANVATVMGFRASAVGGNKKFATTNSGIWDATSNSGAPTQLLAFAETSSRAGWGVALSYVNSAGTHLLYADEVNGLFIYSESTATWAQASITGLDPKLVRHVAAFKKRLMLTEADSSSAWYLDIDAIAGAAVEFSVGNQFRQGGTLVGCWNWTYDGGNGVDDSLVFISTGGDVIVYQGANIADADGIALRGVWTVPPPPAGRRVATDAGGDLLILTRTGVKSLSALVVGNPSDKASNAAWRISNLLAARMAQRADLDGWAILPHPTVNGLMVTMPRVGDTPEQFVLYLPNGSWWPWEGLPIVGAATIDGELYFGTSDGRVCRNAGYVDDRLRTDDAEYEAVECGLLPAFQALGHPRQKKLELLRADFVGGVASVDPKITARYNFDVSRPSQPMGNGGGGPNAWDTGRWDSMLWGGDTTGTSKTKGALGIGTKVSAAIQWNAIGKTTLVGLDVAWNEGGLL